MTQRELTPRVSALISRLVRSVSAVVIALGSLSCADSQKDVQELQSDQSYYISMRDGVRLAVSIYFPERKMPTRKLPTILIQTRYGREWVFEIGERQGGYEYFRDSGAVIAIVDDRGSTASTGSRMLEMGPELIRDMDEVIDHFAERPWSNGQVFTTGVSYMADTADLSTGSQHPALKGAIVREADFDFYRHLFNPGGVANDLFIHSWGTWILTIDTGQTEQDGVAIDCVKRVADCAHFQPNVMPVKDDQDMSQMRSSLRDRVRWPPDAYDSAAFRDDKGANGFTIFQSSPSAYLDSISARALPVQYWGSWIDAGTAAGALDRYRSLPHVPMEVWITANDHLNEQNADPFFPERKTPLPPIDEQRELMRSFFDRLGAGEEIQRTIHYYVLGTGTYRQASTWPPADLSETFLFFAEGSQLTPNHPEHGEADFYEVDFTATTGDYNRWTTQFGAPPDYRDRREEDRKLFVYTGDPVEQDMELAGTPHVTLHVKTRTTDPAFYVYLEDVAPDGYVTYLTEGQFRAVNRKIAEPESLPYDQGPDVHTYAREDAQPMRPDRVEQVRFSLFPLAARIKKGHRLRVAIGGADGDRFRRYSHGQPESFQIHTGGANPSGIAVPLGPWHEGGGET